MSKAMRFLVAESETKEDREKRAESTGRSSGESYAATLMSIVPDARCEVIQPVEPDGRRPTAALSDYDAIFLTGSPLHVYERTPEVERQLEFMRAVFHSGTPSFGSCAGLQVAVAAAGGSVRKNKRGHEVAFARRIVPTDAGRSHRLLAGRPAAFDAAAIHSDEIESLPSEGAVLLATNSVTEVQAAEVRFGNGVFWGVQYHPELPLSEIADAIRRQGEDIVAQGLARDRDQVETYAQAIEALGSDPERRDLAWRLGVNEQVTSTTHRQAELRNFIEHLAKPTHARRGRG